MFEFIVQKYTRNNFPRGTKSLMISVIFFRPQYTDRHYQASVFQLEPLLWTRTNVWAQRKAVPATHLVKVGEFTLNISIRNES